MNPIDKMLDEVRSAIARCPCGEREVYEALADETAGWAMRLAELDAEEGD